MKSCPKIYEFSKKPYPKIYIPYKVNTLKFSIIGDAENDTPKFMTTYNLTKNDTPKFISCSKKGTPKDGTSRTSIYGSYPPRAFVATCRDVGSIVKVGAHFGWAFGSEIEHLVWGVLKKANQLGGSEDMLLREILKLRSSEITRNMYFSIHFCISKLSRRATKLHEKKCTLSESLKSGGHVPLVPPPTSYVHGYMTACFAIT